jgi:hypothetical protein
MAATLASVLAATAVQVMPELVVAPLAVLRVAAVQQAMSVH